MSEPDIDRGYLIDLLLHATSLQEAIEFLGEAVSRKVEEHLTSLLCETLDDDSY